MNNPLNRARRRDRRRCRCVSFASHSETLEDRRLLSAGLVSDVNQAPSGEYRPTAITESAGVGYYGHHDAEHGAELWRSDGTTGGTWMVKDVRPGPAGSFAAYQPDVIADVGGTLFF